MSLSKSLAQDRARPVSDIEAKITQAVEQALDSVKTVAGMQVTVIQGDSMPYAKGFGTRNIQTGEPVTPNTGFYIASATKSFTGMMGALLAEQDSITLDAPISKYFPNLQFDSTGLDANRISLRDHLTHRTGYENEQLAWLPPSIDRLSIQRMVYLVGKYSEPKPITFNYRNESYIMAAAAMKRATGATWKELLVENIFEPLQMDRTTPYISKAKQQEFAWPHGVINNTIYRLEAKVDTNMHAAGGLVASGPDLGRWLRAVMHEGRLDNEQVLPKRAVREALSPQIRLNANFYKFHRFAYGFGWYHSDFRGDLLMHHFGGFTGYHCHMSFMPEYNLGVIVLANSGTILPHNIAVRIYNLVLKRASDKQYAQSLHETAKWTRGNHKEGKKRRKEWLGNPTKNITSYPLSAYTGSFNNQRLGTIIIRSENGKLVAKHGPKRSELKPYQPDVFLVKWSSQSPEFDLKKTTPYKLYFKRDNEGQIVSFQLNHPSFEIGTFQKQ